MCEMVIILSSEDLKFFSDKSLPFALKFYYGLEMECFIEHNVVRLLISWKKNYFLIKA